MSNFRFHSKSIFLTYPQCDYPLKNFRDNIEAYFGDNLEKGVVSQENHQDGNKHLHAAICLHRQVTSRDPKLFDKLVDPAKHPNIAGRFTGGTLKAFDYVMKEGNFLPLNEKSFDLKEFLKLSKEKRNSRASLIVKEFDELPPEDVMENNKDFMLLHGKQMQAYVAWRGERERRLKFAKAQAQKVFVVPAPGYYNAWNNEIASWLTTNLRQKRKHRQKQLWIQGPPGIGKTKMMKKLRKWYSLTIYNWPKDERWWDLYGDGQYDIIMLDEFRSQKMITDLNPILSGDPVTLSRRGMAPIEKRDKLPVIIMSNYTPEECFPNANEHGKLEPLLDRIKVVKCEGPIRLVEGAPPAECSTPFQFDDLPPPPPGSQFVLTDDYSEVFPQTPPEYEIVDDPPERVCNARSQQSTYLHIFPEDREAYARYHGDPNYRLEDEMPAEEAAAVRRSAAAVPYTSADFDRNNDPFYFDKISRQSRAAMLAARNI